MALSARGPVSTSKVSSVASLRSKGDVDSVLSRMEGDTPRARQPQSARQASATSMRLQGSTDTDGGRVSHKAYVQAQKRKEHMQKHEKKIMEWAKHEAALKEKAIKAQHVREQNFNDMLDSLVSDDSVRVEVAKTIREMDDMAYKKQFDQWATWDREVYQRIDMQLAKYMTRKDRDPDSAPTCREELLKSDNPIRRDIHDQQWEDKFKRVADSILKSNPVSGPNDLKTRIREREAIEELVRNRDGVRPALPVTSWGQQELFSTPFGYFAQQCELQYQGEPFHSARRMGAEKHKPDEADGVPAAGKKREKNRTETKHHSMGILEGDHCKMGQAHKHKQAHGGGSAAPMQDHYFFERGNDVVEREFPVGKRTYPHLL
mmetsp:Transcript_62342/g.96981  ORF Transcript_62342/g.96981 Transcript_62342/m.96981 type:complete len:375 (-) Transcript_62342:95-1219(-)|eukprot:CAMPEP_0169203360 /NCGR_PEP_ID=MMETSP1016-20121227/11427_1 /TAXON_ID=342587 /ORGANISM="Karlodinium micrum, Strain CCMP2283" /LENGTH=374 /DNA_ID=CAMNT_0009280403 /DNA_START=111 /DNA_END=1235 /DNA_ORIENTATION=+